MGLFDGHSGDSDVGSAADLARLLGLPVVLVVDASAAARSVAAVVLGFQRFDPRVRIAGVVLNRVAGTAHAEMCRAAIEGATGVRVLGALPRMPDIVVPERHLGLVPDVELGADSAALDRLAMEVGERVDLNALLAAAAPARPAQATGLFPDTTPADRVPIALAMDRAFHFYYQDSLDLLEAHGAELMPFSPLVDASLPDGARLVLLGGGFPEVFARELAGNRGIHEALRDAARAHIPVYGECGGLMYLGRALTDGDGRRHEMVGLLPAESSMSGGRLTLGYREAVSKGTPLLPAGERVRGHEFHYSALNEAPDPTTAAYRFVDDGDRPDGLRAGTVFGTYLHTHLAARRDLAPNLVAAARGVSAHA